MTKTKLHIIIVSLLALFFSACNSSKNSIAQKRKYSKGYYVAFGHKKKHPDAAAIATTHGVKKEQNASAVSPEVAAPAPAEILPASTDEAMTASTGNAIDADVVTAKASFSSENYMATKTEMAPHETISFRNKFHLSKKGHLSKSASGGSADANTVLLVILCLFPFINLIAMYLKDGKTITMNFWIDLILDILFFLPGIIFAILVVLDVVNLA